MRKIIFSIFLVLAITSTNAFAGDYFFLTFTGKTGEVPGTIDNLWCSDPLVGGRDGWGMLKDGTNVSFWEFDFDATDAEDSTHIHCKAGEWTQGVWSQFNDGIGGGSGTVDTSGSPTAGQFPRFVDGDTIEGLDAAAFVAALGLVIGTDVQADLDVPSQAEAEAGTATSERVWTAERIKQAIAALSQLIKLDDFATPDDNTDLNASTSAHGLCPKLNNVSTSFLNGQGAWSTPAGGGDVAGPASSTDKAVARFDSTTGKLLKDTPNFIVEDDGTVNLSDTPGVYPQDSDAPGADKTVGRFGAEYQDGVDGAENSDLVLFAMINGVLTEIMRFDESEDRWELLRDLYVDGNINASGLIGQDTPSSCDTGTLDIRAGEIEEFENSSGDGNFCDNTRLTDNGDVDNKINTYSNNAAFSIDPDGRFLEVDDDGAGGHEDTFVTVDLGETDNDYTVQFLYEAENGPLTTESSPFVAFGNHATDKFTSLCGSLRVNGPTTGGFHFDTEDPSTQAKTGYSNGNIVCIEIDVNTYTGSGDTSTLTVYDSDCTSNPSSVTFEFWNYTCRYMHFGGIIHETDDHHYAVDRLKLKITGGGF